MIKCFHLLNHVSIIINNNHHKKENFSTFYSEFLTLKVKRERETSSFLIQIFVKVN